MVKHIVFFKLTGILSLEEKHHKATRMNEFFSPLPSLLPYIVDFKTGINFNEASHAWDFVIDSIFNNKEELQKYMISPEHVEAVRKATEIDKIKAVIDYEF
jgi:hypothetical protein